MNTYIIEPANREAAYQGLTLIEVFAYARKHGAHVSGTYIATCDRVVARVYEQKAVTR